MEKGQYAGTPGNENISGSKTGDSITVRIDGRVERVRRGITVEELNRQFLNDADEKKPVSARLNGELVDLSHSIDEDGEVAFIDPSQPEGLEILRHSTSHVMAHAVQELFPGTKVTIGPAIDNGFYYDFDSDHTFTPDDFDGIERRMREIIAADHPFVRREVTREEALEIFSRQGEDYKVELIEELPEGETISIYEEGGWVDLCRGPHVTSTGRLGHFRLINISGNYWRGDARNKMLQRITGTAFSSQDDLEKYLQWLEEAKQRDHRRLGRQLDLFQINEEAGAGLIIWHPKGALLRTILEDFERREHLKRGYKIVMGPQLLKMDMWKRSGHYDNYRESMYFTEVEGQQYGLKPMNCLSHMLIYKSKMRSYRELPLRYFELGIVNRHERSGVLHGLVRVRQFTQDDAHLFCTPSQLADEITRIIQFVADMMKVFDFSYEMELSTKPEEKTIGTHLDWEQATAALQRCLEKSGQPYTINEGEGAFYGPKIDVKLRDVLDRQWQCATIQCDFAMPERFDLTYIGEDGQRHRPIMLHRVILGSMERFIGILIEQYKGAFPVWLAPVQAIVMNITDAQREYALQVEQQLLMEGIRIESDVRNEKLGLKIREAQLQKIPYMLVVGNQEMKQGSVSPRLRDGSNLGPISVEQLIARIREESRVEVSA
ncbi:MAG: threonine--tRNA ligase [Deltaproteobacteria bacterium]|nr:threonine--tRNA ligase [Deltaproteobacteria bacterium]